MYKVKPLRSREAKSKLFGQNTPDSRHPKACAAHPARRRPPAPLPPSSCARRPAPARGMKPLTGQTLRHVSPLSRPLYIAPGSGAANNVLGLLFSSSVRLLPERCGGAVVELYVIQSMTQRRQGGVVPARTRGVAAPGGPSD
eukprot:scaffold80994_cov70-Phaeocystis_antarctica.AAC.1